MPHDPRKYVFDMLDAVRFLIDFSKGRQSGDLKSDRAFRSAVERELMIVGEALWALSRTHASVAERITEHARIIRFRHILVHGYDLVDPDLVWAILQDKLPALEKELTQIVDELTSEDGQQPSV
jgi:uncharacterized protein with HEPN domain